MASPVRCQPPRRAPFAALTREQVDVHELPFPCKRSLAPFPCAHIIMMRRELAADSFRLRARRRPQTTRGKPASSAAPGQRPALFLHPTLPAPRRRSAHSENALLNQQCIMNTTLGKSVLFGAGSAGGPGPPRLLAQAPAPSAGFSDPDAEKKGSRLKKGLTGGAGFCL